MTIKSLAKQLPIVEAFTTPPQRPHFRKVKLLAQFFIVPAQPAPLSFYYRISANPRIPRSTSVVASAIISSSGILRPSATHWRYR